MVENYITRINFETSINCIRKMITLGLYIFTLASLQEFPTYWKALLEEQL